MLKSLFRSSPEPKPTSGSTYRSPQVQDEYNVFRKQFISEDGELIKCPLCNEIGVREIVEDHEAVRVIKNDFPYEVFTGVPVLDHLLILPARHVRQISDLTVEESVMYWQICARYGDEGYTMLTQATRGGLRSVKDHVHTHLILC